MRSPHRARFAQPFVALLFAALAASCASTEGEVPDEGVIAKPRATNGFVPNAQVAGWVIAQARYETDFKLKLLEEADVIAIWVKIGDRSRAQDELDVELTPEQMEFRLHLPDGSVLEAVPPEEAEKDDEEITAALVAKALQPGFLKLSGGMKEGCVYFKLPAKGGFEVDGDELTHTVGHVEREIDIGRSLLSFRLRRGGLATSFFIGVAR